MVVVMTNSSGISPFANMAISTPIDKSGRIQELCAITTATKPTAAKLSMKESACLPEFALVDPILQVWFSSTWTGETASLVKGILYDLCQPQRSYHPHVRKTLEHWKDARSMSLVDARKAHARRVSVENPLIGSLKLMIDRVSLAQYELTGDFAVEKGKDLFGNITMFDCPDFTPPPAFDENVFAALDFHRIMSLANIYGPSMSIMEAARRCAREGVNKLVDWCRAGKLDVELICSTF